MAITHYYYNEQIKKWILQFANIFSGLTVKTGKGAAGAAEYMSVPIRYSSSDRLAAMIGQNFTQNKMMALPTMSCYMANIELAPERRKGVGLMDRRTVMSYGGHFPTDLKVLERIMPIPYNMQMELNIYASNTDQMFQILEQIFVLFDPSLQVQSTDAPFDWTKITMVELVGVSNNENNPPGTDKRMIQYILNFNMPIWIAPPMDFKTQMVNDIIVRLGLSDNGSFKELVDDGEQCFSNPALTSGQLPNAGQSNRNVTNDRMTIEKLEVVYDERGEPTVFTAPETPCAGPGNCNDCAPDGYYETKIDGATVPPKCC